MVSETAPLGTSEDNVAGKTAPPRGGTLWQDGGAVASSPLLCVPSEIASEHGSMSLSQGSVDAVAHSGGDLSPASEGSAHAAGRAPKRSSLSLGGAAGALALARASGGDVAAALNSGSAEPDAAAIAIGCGASQRTRTPSSGGGDAASDRRGASGQAESKRVADAKGSSAEDAHKGGCACTDATPKGDNANAPYGSCLSS